MTDTDEWACWSLKFFDREREKWGSNCPWPGYWANCILNYADFLKLVWC